MAGPGRPRKIQNEVVSEIDIQEVSNDTNEEAADSPAVASIELVFPVDGYTSELAIQPKEVDPLPINGHGGKIESLSIDGWLPIETVSHNGFPVKVTDDQNKEGVIAFWRKTRAFANATHRWQETGKWTDSTTGNNIDFVPKFWKDRYA